MTKIGHPRNYTTLTDVTYQKKLDALRAHEHATVRRAE